MATIDIRRIASDPIKGRLLSAKMILAKRDGSDILINVGKKRITLKRLTPLR